MISEISLFLYFPDGNWPPCWIFKSIKCYMQTRSGGLMHITMPNFLETGLSKADILRLFQIFKMAAAAILDFWNRNFGGEGRDASACQISSKLVIQLQRYCDCFKFSKWPPPPSHIFEIAKFYWLFEWRRSRCISMPNFVKIGQSVVKI